VEHRLYVLGCFVAFHVFADSVSHVRVLSVACAAPCNVRGVRDACAVIFSLYAHVRVMHTDTLVPMSVEARDPDPQSIIRRYQHR